MKKSNWAVCFIWLIAVTLVQGISRADFYSLWGMYSLAFAAYAWLLFSKQGIDIRVGLMLALLARIISLFYEPLLSDDYFRFIWDGLLMHQGIHPMAYTPSYLIQHPGIGIFNEQLFSLLNSPEYYSVYPPVAQLFFRLSYAVNGMNIAGHIIFYKLLLISTDALITYLLYRLLKHKNISTQRLFWYALNPLILIEFAGNLHMDGIMIAGLLGAVLLSGKKNIGWSSVLMAMSILSKLLTLVLIPFLPRQLYWKKILAFSFLSVAISASVIALTFGAYTGWLNSVRLWFHSFEFNASLYYMARSIGFELTGYNTIAQTGPGLAFVTLIGIGIIWWRYISKRGMDWAQAMLYVLTLYFLLSTTVHPWYLGILLTLSILTVHIYPLVWTYLAFLSYSHYSGGGSEENYWLITTEYVLLFSWMGWEWYTHRKRQAMAERSND